MLLLYPFQDGTQFFQYDSTTHTANLQDNPAQAHSASYTNAARITTYMRPGVEQFHGAIFRTYKVKIFYIMFLLLSKFFRFCVICQQVFSSL